MSISQTITSQLKARLHELSKCSESSLWIRILQSNFVLVVEESRKHGIQQWRASKWRGKQWDTAIQSPSYESPCRKRRSLRQGFPIFCSLPLSFLFVKDLDKSFADVSYDFYFVSPSNPKPELISARVKLSRCRSFCLLPIFHFI